MSYKFEATSIVVDDDGYTTVVSIANGSEEPTKYVILQMSNEFDDQDKELGMDSLYVQVGDLNNGVYGGIVSAIVDSSAILLRFDAESSKQLDIDGEVEIDVSQASTQVESAVPVIRNMLVSSGINIT